MPTRSPLPLLTKASDARTAILQGLLIAAIVITALYVGRDVLLPLALSILLGFVLTPPLLLLRRIKVPRVARRRHRGGVRLRHHLRARLAPVARGDAARRRPADLPLRAHRDEDQGLAREHAELARVQEGRRGPLRACKSSSSTPRREATRPRREVGAKPSAPTTSRSRSRSSTREPTGFELYQRIAGTLLPPLVTAGIVLLFVVFILLQREDLRDRFIRLVGASDLQRATTTLNDAATA